MFTFLLKTYRLGTWFFLALGSVSYLCNAKAFCFASILIAAVFGFYWYALHRLINRK